MLPTAVTIGIPYRDEGRNLTLLAGGLLAALDELPRSYATLVKVLITCWNGRWEPS